MCSVERKSHFFSVVLSPAYGGPPRGYFTLTQLRELYGTLTLNANGSKNDFALMDGIFCTDFFFLLKLYFSSASDFD